MGDRNRELVETMHSEAWWIRVLDHELTPAEQRQWEAHLQACEACRSEWAALAVVDQRLREGSIPLAPAGLGGEVVARALRAQRRLRLLRYAVGGMLVMMVGLILLSVLGVTLAEIGREVAVLVSARRLLIRPLVQVAMALVLEWKTLLPYILALTALICLLVMLHGVLVTLMLLWLAQRRGSVGALGASALGGRLALVQTGR